MGETMRSYFVRIAGRPAVVIPSPASVAAALLDGMGEDPIRVAYSDLLDLLDVGASDPLPPRSALAAIIADDVESFGVGDCAWAGDDYVERIQ